ncbi:MAG: hypothetical protein U1D55_16445 [Phycisphaerae bacterium]
MEPRLLGTLLRNLKIYSDWNEIGFDYILNPDTGELHRVAFGNFFGSHNLAIADLANFVGLTNVGLVRVDALPDGAQVPVYNILTGEIIGTYKLNKCRHCFQ